VRVLGGACVRVCTSRGTRYDATRLDYDAARRNHESKKTRETEGVSIPALVA
jgi:hypothetical protein